MGYFCLAKKKRVVRIVFLIITRKNKIRKKIINDENKNNKAKKKYTNILFKQIYIYIQKYAIIYIYIYKHLYEKIEVFCVFKKLDLFGCLYFYYRILEKIILDNGRIYLKRFKLHTNPQFF